MIVCGTGHRPDKLGTTTPERHEQLVQLAVHWLDRNNPEKVLVGMAQGWDTILADACVCWGTPFVAYLPCEDQEVRWPFDDRRHFHRLLNDAERVSIVSHGRYEHWKMQARNEYMVDGADLILAVWNGSPSGTKNCVEYARRQNKPVTNLWDEWKKVRT
jgi:hypothetical protein